MLQMYAAILETHNYRTEKLFNYITETNISNIYSSVIFMKTVVTERLSTVVMVVFVGSLNFL